MVQMFTKAYIILVHKSPMQVKRLIDSLDDGQSFFFIHVDWSVDINQFKSLFPVTDHVRFVTREVTKWASYGIVRAILNGLDAIKESAIEFKRVILLSGQDYPIKSNQYIEDWADADPGGIFLEYFQLPAPQKWQPQGGLYRVNKYFLGLSSFNRFVSRSLNFMQRYVPLLRRKIYRGMKPFAGSMWWNLNMDAVRYILDFVKENPGYVKFHKYTFASDEVFFHTILLNAVDTRIAANIRNTDLRFIKWKDQQASHPETISGEDLAALAKSNALFARKFDEQTDAVIMQLIDEHRNLNYKYEMTPLSQSNTSF